MKQMLYILFGWGLGIFSSIILEGRTRAKKLSEFKRSLEAELRGLERILIDVSFLLSDYLGTIDHKQLDWLILMCSKLPKSESTDNRIKGYKSWYKLSPEELVSFIESKSKAQVGKSLGLKKYKAPFLENNLSTLTIMPTDLQTHIFAFQHKLWLINQDIDAYNFYLQKSFDPRAMEISSEPLIENMRMSIKSVCRQAMLTVEEIQHIYSIINMDVNRTEVRKYLASYKDLLFRLTGK